MKGYGSGRSYQHALDYNRRYRKEHPEAVKRWRRTEYKKNRKKIDGGKKRWVAEHYQHHLEYHRRYYREHREKLAKQTKQYAKEHVEMVNLWNRNKAQRLKEEVFSHYSPDGHCVGWNQKGCPFNCKEFDCESIDHIKGGGGQHRRELGRRGFGREFYRWLKKNNWPEGYQVLCMNCQWVKKARNQEFGQRFKNMATKGSNTP